MAFNESDGTFKPVQEVREMCATLGVTSDREVITYCRVGERSSLSWFVLTQVLGYENVRNYDGSWLEYSSLIGAPIER
jgi:thiosulfate/3-mercaptopyruvate sulfurtransferase